MKAIQNACLTAVDKHSSACLFTADGGTGRRKSWFVGSRRTMICSRRTAEAEALLPLAYNVPTLAVLSCVPEPVL
jgi:hypothetical protein